MSNPAIICEDNTGAIFLATNSQVGMRTKKILMCAIIFYATKLKTAAFFLSMSDQKITQVICAQRTSSKQIHDRHANNILNGTIDCWNREDVKSNSLSTVINSST